MVFHRDVLGPPCWREGGPTFPDVLAAPPRDPNVHKGGLSSSPSSPWQKGQNAASLRVCVNTTINRSLWSRLSIDGPEKSQRYGAATRGNGFLLRAARLVRPVECYSVAHAVSGVRVRLRRNISPRWRGG